MAFVIGYSAMLNIPILKHILWVVYVTAMVGSALRCYTAVFHADILQMGALLLILVVMQGSQAFLLAE